MQLLNFFKKFLFNQELQNKTTTGSPKDILFSDNVDAETIPFRFFILVNTECTLTKWDFVTIKNYLQNYFLSCPESKAFELTGYSHALISYITEFKPEERDVEWRLIYRHLHLRFQTCSKENQVKLFSECLPVAMMYKATSETIMIGEIFFHRLNELEKFSQLSKDELAELFEEAREIAEAAK